MVSIRHTGLGDRLASLAAAWRYARCTGRVLVVDWRFGNFTSNMENTFTQCFEAVDDLAGVRFIADRSVFPPSRWRNRGFLPFGTPTR